MHILTLDIENILILLICLVIVAPSWYPQAQKCIINVLGHAGD